ncbi:hypothetical protein PoB_007459600 [Plakobranchus ocellatus]|uniref:Uncharacterized protein n=1 Tax=Plakobranchus ocellatus TaxID=259542 RepID=A0AAV4DW60_9GAST|nr:hypothetical protein PoB_007459600 [Plakobranchus ocellatus]
MGGSNASQRIQMEDDRSLAFTVGQAFKSFSKFIQLLKKREEKPFKRLVIGQGSELVSYANQRLKGLKYADCLVYRKVTSGKSNVKSQVELRS